jgi:hypothetical protein
MERERLTLKATIFAGDAAGIAVRWRRTGVRCYELAAAEASDPGLYRRGKCEGHKTLEDQGC